MRAGEKSGKHGLALRQRAIGGMGVSCKERGFGWLGSPPIAGGWNAKFVIVEAKQGIKGKRKGTARFQLKGKSLSARNALARKVTRGCH